MSNPTCTIPDCGKPHRARGLCAYHYKIQHPTPPTTKQVACAGCGLIVTRTRPQRWGATYCSELCRHWIQWGAWSSALPLRHAALPRAAKMLKVRAKATRHDFLCEWCGSMATSFQSARFCSGTCNKRSSRARRRAAEHGSVGTYTWSDVTRLWLTFDKACAYCLTPTPLPEIQAEHVHPISKGGANNTSNLLPSCGPCNADKRDLLLNAWALDRERRGLGAVVTEWDENDLRYAHLVLHAPLAA